MQPEDDKPKSILGLGLGLAAIGMAAGLLFRRLQKPLRPDDEYLAEERQLLEALPVTIDSLERQLAGLEPMTHSAEDTRRILDLARRELELIEEWQKFDLPTRRALHDCEISLSKLEQRLLDHNHDIT